jgi:Spy/CpxP family protein refolding chaperone
MSKPIVAIALGLLLALPASASAQAPAAAPASNAAQLGQTMTKFRDELQALETQVVSKGVTLTTEEATAFWPVFKRFQAEQRKVIDGQIAAVRQYADRYAALSDADSMAYVNALLSRDQQIQQLRVKYLAEYAKVIGKNKAARVIHISRKLGLASQSKLAEVIPVVR